MRTHSLLEAKLTSMSPRLCPVLGSAGFNRIALSKPVMTVDPKVAAALPFLVNPPPDSFQITAPTSITRLGPGEALSCYRSPVTALIGVSGGPAAGGLDFMAGFLDGLPAGSTLLGLPMGVRGLLKADKFPAIPITRETLARFRNLGGFDLTGTARDLPKPERLAEDLEKCYQAAVKYNARILTLYGGDDTQTTLANLANYFLQRRLLCSVIGGPKTIDDDLQSPLMPQSIGFHSASSTYAHLVGAIARDTCSARKQWHFAQLMGRAASHITLEVALQVHPHVTLIGEEVQAKNWKLAEVVNYMAEIIAARQKTGKNYGVGIIPEGLVEFIPEMRELKDKISQIILNDFGKENFAALEANEKIAEITSRLGNGSAELLSLFQSFPVSVQKGFLEKLDEAGNVQVNKIPTTELLIHLVSQKLKVADVKFEVLKPPHYFGYEGRCVPPTRFESDLAYNAGRLAAIAGMDGMTGGLVGFENIHRPVSEWLPIITPIAGMMGEELREGILRPVVRKALVDLQRPAFLTFAGDRAKWAVDDWCVDPGPIQYWGLPELVDSRPLTLRLNAGESVQLYY